MSLTIFVLQRGVISSAWGGPISIRNKAVRTPKYHRQAHKQAAVKAHMKYRMSLRPILVAMID